VTSILIHAILESAIITLKNNTVSKINNCIFNMLPGMKRVYLSTDIVCKTSSDGDNADILYLVEFINQLEFNGVSSHTISLRIGTPIMFLCNLNLSAGLCNGTKLIVTQLAIQRLNAITLLLSNLLIKFVLYFLFKW